MAGRVVSMSLLSKRRNVEVQEFSTPTEGIPSAIDNYYRTRSQSA